MMKLHLLYALKLYLDSINEFSSLKPIVWNIELIKYLCYETEIKQLV